MSSTGSLSRHRALGLTDAEYELIVERIEREPNDVELAMLSLMWSEHCAYKHSKRLLRRLPTDGPHVLVGPGEAHGPRGVTVIERPRERDDPYPHAGSLP